MAFIDQLKGLKRHLATGGRSEQQMRRHRDEHRAVLKTEIEAENKPNIIISGEALYGAPPDALNQLKAALDPYAKSYRIVGYLRPPVSHAQSVFQQALNFGRHIIFPALPSYRRPLTKHGNVFGSSTLTIRKFSRATLLNGDVVQDFADVINADVQGQEILRTNESLSLEATSILAAHLRYGQHQLGYPTALTVQRYLMSLLEPVGETKLEFQTELAHSVLEQTKNDTDWVKSQFGISLSEEIDPGPLAIGTPEDLLQVAAGLDQQVRTIVCDAAARSDTEVSAEIDNRLEQVSTHRDPAKRVAAHVDVLKDILRCDADVEHQRRRDHRRQQKRLAE